ncbi:MAG TPA: hemolysin family protein, partial [Anaerolineaceae bacterium]
MLFWNILLVLLLVALNAFFVSVEFAAVTSRRSRIEMLAGSGNRAARIVKTWLENPAARDRLIAASQLGITIVSLALGAVGENTFQVLLQPLFQNLNLPGSYQVISRLLPALPLVLALIIVTSLHVVMGEQVPKVATLQDPERVALLAARPMQIFSTIFKWFISLLDWTTRQVLGWAGIEMMGEHTLMYSVEEIKHILSESEEGGVIETPEREMLDAIFDMGDLLARQVMVPRTEIVAVEANTPLPEIIGLISKSTYTKFPVYEENLDQILGIVHVKDLLQAMQSEDCKTCTARSLAREPIYVPETTPVSSLLQKFRTNRQHIAIVLDEYGGTAGLVTLEDLLEEIVGEVSDPFDVTKPEFQTLPDGAILVDGLTLIEEVNDQLGLHLQDPNYDTIAGYMLGRLGRIPRPKDAVDGEGIRLQVESMDGMRIARLRLTTLE